LSDPLDRKIDFDFDSFVRGEAKLCASVRDVLPYRWGREWDDFLLHAAAFRVIVAAMHIVVIEFGMFVKHFGSMSLLYVWTLKTE
jgi:hypothetical protein